MSNEKHEGKVQIPMFIIDFLLWFLHAIREDYTGEIRDIIGVLLAYFKLRERQREVAADVKKGIEVEERKAEYKRLTDSANKLLGILPDMMAEIDFE